MSALQQSQSQFATSLTNIQTTNNEPIVSYLAEISNRRSKRHTFDSKELPNNKSRKRKSAGVLEKLLSN